MSDYVRVRSPACVISCRRTTYACELQRPSVERLRRLCRLANTTFDILFYDVGVLTAVLLRKGATIETGVSTNLGSARHPFATLARARFDTTSANWRYLRGRPQVHSRPRGTSNLQGRHG